MALRDKFKMSPKLETAGIQYEFDTARVTIARAGGSNARYTAAMARVAREHGRAAQMDMLSSEKGLAIVREVYVDTVILNWETKVGEEYKPGLENVFEESATDLLPFTKENVLAALTELPDLFIEIKTMAENLTVFRQSNLEVTAKN